MSLGIIPGEDLFPSTCPPVTECQFLYLHKAFCLVSRKERSRFCHMTVFIENSV